MKRTAYLLLLISLCVLCCPAKLVAKPHIISPDNLGVEASSATFNVTVTTDKKTYQAGEHLVATITASQDCHILVYYTNEEGYCLIVYPNKYESEDRLKAGKPFIIGNKPESFCLEVDVEKTRDYLQVLATDEPICTSSLIGIRDPSEFINRIRLILKERVEDRARSKEPERYEHRVFGIGTADYLCNISSYSPPKLSEKPAPPEVPAGTEPVISIRTVKAPDETASYTVGPSASADNCIADDSSEYQVKGGIAEIRGTASYGKGIKRVLVDGNEATIHRIGSSRSLDIKSIAIGAPDAAVHTILDFSYILKDLGPAPREIRLTVEGMDGRKTVRVLKLSGR